MKKFIFSLFLFFSVAAYAQKDSLVKPTANISGLTKGAITIQQLRDAKEISVSDSGCVVKGYRFSAYAKDKDPVAMDFNSGTIPAKLKEEIAKLPAGTKVYFEYIKARDAKGNELLLPALGFTLK